MPLYTAPAATVSPAAVNYMEMFGHSYLLQPVGTGTAVTSITPDRTGEIGAILATSLNLSPNEIRNHAMTSTTIAVGQRSQCGFARILAEIPRKRQTYPFLRSGGLYLFCYGINDLGNFAMATSTQTMYKHSMRLAISRARASAVYLASGGANWTFGSNFAAAATTFTDYTGGAAMRATAIDSAGTSTATFKIPLGYQGEPLVFTIAGAIGTAGGDITWGGTVTGTSGIIGTVTTTDSMGMGGTQRGMLCVRYTAATNGLSSSNAGQTITLKITRVSASGEILIDAAWIEASKPDPVITCNVPRLACRKMTMRVGDLSTTSGSATVTSSTALFASGTDAGFTNAMTQVSGTAAIPAGTTISSITNATTAVLSANATSTSTVVVDFERVINGYAQYSANTNFSAATPASHAAADADVASMNSWLTTIVAEFDSMVQIADLDTALGLGDTVRPSNVISYFATIDGLHPNELGNARCARAIFDAITRLAPVDQVDLGALEFTGIPSFASGSQRLPRRSGLIYLPPFGTWGTAVTVAAGDVWAYPMIVTEAAENWGALNVRQTNAPTTAGSNMRWGVYDDVNWNGYPQALFKEPTGGGAVAMGTAIVDKVFAGLNWNTPPGLYWIVLKCDSLGTTASQLQGVNGPNPFLANNWATGSTNLPVAYKLTGQAAGVLPNLFPSGATLVANAPAVGITIN